MSDVAIGTLLARGRSIGPFCIGVGLCRLNFGKRCFEFFKGQLQLAGADLLGFAAKQGTLELGEQILKPLGVFLKLFARGAFGQKHCLEVGGQGVQINVVTASCHASYFIAVRNR